MAWSSCRLRRVVGHRIQRVAEWVLRGRLERERLRVELRRACFDLAVERAAREAAEERAYQAEKRARNAEVWAGVRVQYPPMPSFPTDLCDVEVRTYPVIAESEE